MRTWALLIATVMLCGVGTLSRAEEIKNYARLEVVAGMQKRVGYYATAKKDCTPEPPPTVRVIEPPRQGVLTVRSGQLATNRFAGCPRIKTPVNVVFYRAGSKALGRDHFVYEITDIKGTVQLYDFTVDIKKAVKKKTPKDRGI